MGGDWSYGIRARVMRLAEVPEANGVFAADAHRFALEAPLTMDEVEEAEQFFGIRLPGDYRSFLLQVGAGGAGPGYGIFPLRRMSDSWEWIAEDTHRTEAARLGEPFAPQHIGGAIIDPARLQRPVQFDFEYREDYLAEHDRWQETIWHPDRTAGAICLSDEGCLRGHWLAVSGDERGMVWRDHRIDGMDLSPLFDANGRRLTFSRWYLSWLDEAENSIMR